jgi:hypothetical protein
MVSPKWKGRGVAAHDDPPLGLRHWVDAHPESPRQRYLVQHLVVASPFLAWWTAHQERPRRHEVEAHLDALAQPDRPLGDAGPHALLDEFHDPSLPHGPLWVLLRYAAGAQESPVQSQQFGPPRVVVLFQPVGQDEVAILGLRVRDDSTQKVFEPQGKAGPVRCPGTADAPEQDRSCRNRSTPHLVL